MTLAEPFGWLDDAGLDDPQVIRLMAEFEAASDRIMVPLAGLTGRLLAEAIGAVPSSLSLAPVPDGAFGYWSDWSQGHRQLWRIHLVSGARQLLLNAVPERKLPPVYLTASLADVRIPWCGVLNYVARLRAAHPDNKVALRLARDGNHWGPADPETGETWRAERVAFALSALGIAWPIRNSCSAMTPSASASATGASAKAS